ncbi:MAG: hypothetical protein Q8S33_10140 [Myxococcales bacterium]|nr:hypothetical protein [Myxococcales bacterium]MDP3500684.1 hypothetical protein [Myxococcales bacterium]
MIRPLVMLWVLALDAGVTVAPATTPAVAPATLSAEDLEVVKNLELLENLDSSTELELLQELSLER